MTMAIEIFDVEQGTEEWLQCRLGMPTASCFDIVQMSGRKKGEPSVTRLRYMRRLCAERLSGRSMSEYTFKNDHMARGNAWEQDVCDVYAYANGVELSKCGFIRHNGHRCGCSVDRFVGDSGILSCKTALPDLLIEYHEQDRFPPEHMAQSQGELWITGRAWLDIAIYWPGLPLFVKRIKPDPHYILNLADAIRSFNGELDQLEGRMRRKSNGFVLKDDLKDSIVQHDQMMTQAMEAPPWTA